MNRPATHPIGLRTVHGAGPRSAAALCLARLGPAPVRQPGFDDEQASPDLRRPGHLRLIGHDELTLPFGEDLSTPARERLSPQIADDFTRRPTGRGELPDPTRFGRDFVQALVEVMTGRRPVAQLARHTTIRVHAGLVRDHGAPATRGRLAHAPVLHSVRVMEPADGVAELSAVVRFGPRYRAIAARIEGLDGHWRCVRLQIG
jgi:hypothetical protein